MHDGWWEWDGCVGVDDVDVDAADADGDEDPSMAWAWSMEHGAWMEMMGGKMGQGYVDGKGKVQEWYVH